jgi:TetR/AcrR family transcriptional regulator
MTVSSGVIHDDALIIYLDETLGCVVTERPTGRRSPTGEERQRDAERSRRLLMEAAVAEFSAHGLRGSRVSAIADRAGVNKQLISYYFGGKHGLYEAISDQWRREEQGFADPATPLPELVAEYARQTVRAPDLARLVIREGLDGPPGSDRSVTAQQERFAKVLLDLRRRQEAGELGPDLDAAAVGLAMFAMGAAAVSFPHLARAMGLDPEGPDFAEHYAEQIARMVSRLAGPPRGPGPDVTSRVYR